MIVWRISNHQSLSGEGGLRTPGRWHTRGRRVVYCAQSPAAALLEILVHLELDIQGLPARYRLLRIEVPDGLDVEHVSLDTLPADWPEKTELTRTIGDAWLVKGHTPLLSVPSAIVPETENVLLNPAHPDATRIAVVRASQHPIDPRLLR